jgi:Fur family ferric uptake transcriptional regulator
MLTRLAGELTLDAMSASQQPTWAENAANALSAAGYRRGGARTAMLELLDRQRCALSAVEIEEALRKGGERGVARASVYRILEELEELRLVNRVDVGQGLARFEAARAGRHHHHMVCDRCGEVLPFEDPELERSIQRLTERVPFSVEEHEVVLHGECADCSS